MRTRLQMTPEEARLSRAHMINDRGELAVWAGSPSSSLEDIDAALARKYNGFLHAKEALVQREEIWRVWFMRCPGGWLTKGQRLHPEPGEIMPGRKLPRYVRLAVPVTPDGKVPASLAPRRADLPGLVAGRWRDVGPRATRPPTLTLTVDAPRYGVLFYATGSPDGPVLFHYPINKAKIGPALRRLAERTKQAHFDRERRPREESEQAARGT